MSSRGMIAARQRNTNYHPTFAIAPHVLASTITAPGLSGEVIIRRAGRSFTTGNGLVVRKGETCILVASKFAGRYYVLHGGHFSTNDEKVIQVLRGKILKHDEDEKAAQSFEKNVQAYGNLKRDWLASHL